MCTRTLIPFEFSLLCRVLVGIFFFRDKIVQNRFIQLQVRNFNFYEPMNYLRICVHDVGEMDCEGAIEGD